MEGEPDQLRALRTALGWTLFGPDPRARSSESQVVNCRQSPNDVLQEQMKRILNYEFSDNSQISYVPYSVELSLFCDTWEFTEPARKRNHCKNARTPKKTEVGRVDAPQK